MKMTNMKRWLVSGAVACLFNVLGSPMEDPPNLQDFSATYDRDKNEWVVSGVYQFTTLHVYVFPVEFRGFRRTGEFALRVPDNGTGSMSSGQCKEKAIAQAKGNAGPWIPNLVVVLSAILISTVVIRLLWWLF